MFKREQISVRFDTSEVLSPGTTMSPVLLLFLLPTTLSSESTSTQAETSTGLKFIVAFPENIAYYHPDQPQNKVRITALYHNTELIIKMNTSHIQTEILNARQTWEFAPDAKLELDRSEIANKTLLITSDKLITVHVVSLKSNSMQTILITPADRLGTEYLIPPVPMIEGTTHPVDMVMRDVAERGPFKLIIINVDQENTVTVQGAVSKVVSLQPYQVAQIWVKTEDILRTVKADQPVAVLFGHSCAIRYNCTCGQLYTLLPSAREEQQKFYIPPVLAKGAEDETFVLLSTQVSPFNSNSGLVMTAGTAMLYRPGLLLPLIPEIDFAACSVVSFITSVQNFAVIVVHKDFTDGVHVGSRPLESPEWQQLQGTELVSTSVVLASNQTVIWHSFSKMAVYFLGKKAGAVFGHPAAVVSKIPDIRGCVVSPEVVKIGQHAGSWQESLKYCKDNNLELVSFPKAQLQRQIYDKIVQAKNDSLQVVWIGMRRSSQTGEWYWLSRDPVTDTNWGDGEPGMVHDGQCAIMSLERSKDFGWSDENCCKNIHPLCYSSPVLLSV
uniref:uncharacterized protein LOC124065420 n=1 Tax=Scatophagus argus TaxID=75038 RepID=UPI001ED836F3|nr:uncharacterized protein LOC124065420 [Scatophagus argus]